MKKAIKLFALVLGMMAIACNKPEIGPEVLPNEDGLIEVVFTASQGTKTNMQADGKIFWEKDDAIGVEYNGIVYELKMDEPQNGIYSDEATFRGMVPAGVEAAKAYYPYKDESVASYIVPVKTVQPYTEGTFAKDILPMVATVNSDDLEFTASATVVMVPDYTTTAKFSDVVLSYGATDITLKDVPEGTNNLIFVVDALGQTSFTVDGVVYKASTTVAAGNRYKLAPVTVSVDNDKNASLSTSQDSSIDATDDSLDAIEDKITPATTNVSGVTLTTEGDAQTPAGVQAVVDNASAELGSNLTEADKVNIHIDVKVTPYGYTATAGQEKISFDLDPVATVTTYKNGVQTASATTAVTNDMIDQNVPIVVNLYTGFAPKQIVHKNDDGTVIKTYESGSFTYNPSTGVVTLTVSHFSYLEAYGENTNVDKTVYAAQIGKVKYDTLLNAAAAATSGQTITLLADIEDAGSVNLPAGVTLDGDGYKISGDSSIWINAAGGTIQNVVFESIHDNSTPEATDISKYNLPADKVGTLTAVYARALTGELHITGCTFDNADWDAIQITPQNGSTIDITNNTFTHTNTETSQIRYVHIESSVTKSPYVSAAITVTDNKFYDTEAVGVRAICNIGAYYINYTTGATVNYSGNWFETIKNCDIKNGSSDNEYYIYPARSQANVDVDDKCPAARSVATPIDYYETLQKAFDSGADLILMKNADEDVDVPESYKKQLQLREFRIKGTITNNGVLDITATPSDEEFTGRVINNGTLKSSNQYRLIGLQIVNNGRFEIAVADGFVGDLSTITNNTDGLIVISKGTYKTAQLAAMGGTIEITGGTFDAKPNDEWIPFGYLATDKGNGTFTVAKMTDAQAVEHGAITRTGSSTSTSRVYYTTIPESVSDDIYLLTTVNGEYNRTTTTTLNLNGYGFTGSLDDAGYNLTLKTKSKTETTAIFNALKCKSLTVGYKTTSASSAQPVIATVKNGTITGALTVNVSATLNVEGGTFNDSITVSEHAVNSKTGVETITGGTLNISGGQFLGTITVGTGATLTITGGTFSSDPSNYVATGYKAENNGDGTWTVSAE